METSKCIRTRRSVRKFTDKKIDDIVLDEILETAIHAPNAGNIQEWEFIVVKKKDAKEKLSEASFQQAVVTKAPVVIVSCANLSEIGRAYGKRGSDVYSIQDAAIASQNLMLAAWDKGIGSCWIGSFNENAVQDALVLPKHVRPLAIILLGYPDSVPKMQEKKKLADVVHEEFY